MNYNQVLQYIIQWIKENHNNEITGNILQGVLIEMLQYVKVQDDDFVIDIQDLQNQIDNITISQDIKVFQGENNPNITPPNEPFNAPDFYVKTDTDDIFVFTGDEWYLINQEAIVNSILKEIEINDLPNNTKEEVVNYINNLTPPIQKNPNENFVITLLDNGVQVSTFLLVGSDSGLYGDGQRQITENNLVHISGSGSDFQGITTTNSDDITLSGNGTEADPLEAELTQDVKDEIAKGVEAHDYTLDDVVQNGNETTKSIILSSEEHPSESIEIGVKELAPGVVFGVIELFSANGYGILSANSLGFSVDGKIAAFSASGIESSFSDGKSLSIRIPTDNPIPYAPNINTWFVLSVNGGYPNEKGEIRLPENEQQMITSSGLLTPNYNNHTVFFDGTNLTIDVDMNISELPPRAEVYFYNLGDSDVEFNFIVAPGWSLPDDATLEPNGTCILMRVLDEQKLILIGNE